MGRLSKSWLYCVPANHEESPDSMPSPYAWFFAQVKQNVGSIGDSVVDSIVRRVISSSMGGGYSVRRVMGSIMDSCMKKVTDVLLQLAVV